MHPRATVAAALQMSRAGASSGEIGSALALSPRTVRDWLSGRVPHCVETGQSSGCLTQHCFNTLGSDYVYLLGLYLGDGYLAQHPRGVYKLRLILDARYSDIVRHAHDAVRAVAGKGAVYSRSDNCVEVCAYWRHWPCYFPQHGPGPKHGRLIVLADWQVRLTQRWPEELLRGLIHSDGCRFVSTGRGGWSAARYAFKNQSVDIHRIFRSACDQLRIRHTAAGTDTTYISRKADVARLDAFIGPKA